MERITTHFLQGGETAPWDRYKWSFTATVYFHFLGAPYSSPVTYLFSAIFIGGVENNSHL